MGWKVFEGNGEPHSAKYEACEWLRDNGYSVGSSSVDGPAGVKKGLNIYIPKWRNMSDEDQRNLDGLLYSSRIGLVSLHLKVEPEENLSSQGEDRLLIYMMASDAKIISGFVCSLIPIELEGRMWTERLKRMTTHVIEALCDLRDKKLVHLSLSLIVDSLKLDDFAKLANNSDLDQEIARALVSVLVDLPDTTYDNAKALKFSAAAHNVHSCLAAVLIDEIRKIDQQEINNIIG